MPPTSGDTDGIMPKVHYDILSVDKFAGVCDELATFRIEKPVSDRIALPQTTTCRDSARGVRCVSDVLARWTLENDRRTNLFDTFLIHIFTYFVL